MMIYPNRKSYLLIMLASMYSCIILDPAFEKSDDSNPKLMRREKARALALLAYISRSNECTKTNSSFPYAEFFSTQFRMCDNFSGTLLHSNNSKCKFVTKKIFNNCIATIFSKSCDSFKTSWHVPFFICQDGGWP